MDLLKGFKATPSQMAKDEINRLKHEALKQKGVNVNFRSINRAYAVSEAVDLGASADTIKSALFTEKQLKAIEEDQKE